MLDKFLKSDFPDMFTNWAFLIVWMLFFPQSNSSRDAIIQQWKLFIKYIKFYFKIPSIHTHYFSKIQVFTQT